MVTLTLLLYGRPVITTRPLPQPEAAARIAHWSRIYIRAGEVLVNGARVLTINPSIIYPEAA